MSIGTPLSPSATRVLLLGSGELGKEVAIELQRLGCEVIACDRYADAPAMQVAHRSHVLSMLDGDALRAVIAAEQPHLVVPEIEAIATDVLVELEAQGLHVVPTARAANLTMNREGIRRFAAEELGVATSPYRFVESADGLRAALGELGLPAVLKPIMSSSGKGQSVLRSLDDVDAAWTYAQEGGRAGGARCIVEGFVDFDVELTLLTVSAVNGIQCCAPIGHVQVDGDYRESWQPAPIPGPLMERAVQVATAVVEGLGGHGIFGVELFCAGDEVIFSEVSPRPHDTGMVTMASQAQNEFELHARAILGLPVDTRMIAPAAASAVVYGGVDAKGLRFANVDEALAVPCSDLRLFGKPEAYRTRRMGVALATADTADEARARAKACAARVRPLAG